MTDTWMNVESLIKQFLLNLQALNKCMKDDQRYFSTNDLLALEQSDLEKGRINTILVETMNRLDSSLLNIGATGDLFTALSNFASTLDISRQSIVRDLNQKIQEEYQTGVQLMQLNRHVVDANLLYIKDVVNHFTQGAPLEKNHTYDETGAIL